MKLRHDTAGTRRELDVRGDRVEVDEGSKPAAAGVIRALRFGVMLSSILARDMRRKSKAKRLVFLVAAQGLERGQPLSATVEKQNCGVSLGGGAGWAMMSGGLGASGVEDFDQRNLATVKGMG